MTTPSSDQPPLGQEQEYPAGPPKWAPAAAAGRTGRAGQRTRGDLGLAVRDY